jgi:hypothetical protein
MGRGLEAFERRRAERFSRLRLWKQVVETGVVGGSEMKTGDLRLGTGCGGRRRRGGRTVGVEGGMVEKS